MALTIREISNEQIDLAKKLTGEKTASKAVISCIEPFSKQQELINSLTQQCELLKNENRSLKQKIKNAELSARQFLEKISQNDLF